MTGSRPSLRIAAAVGVLLLLCERSAVAAERFPLPDFESGHTLPTLTQPVPDSPWFDVAYVAALALGLSLATWLALRRRSRTGLAWLSAA